MSLLLEALERHAGNRHAPAAIENGLASLSYAQLISEATKLAGSLRQRQVRMLGVFADNTPAWAIANIAAIMAHVPIVPLPMFFTPLQVRHTLADAGVDWLLTDHVQQLQGLLSAGGIEPMQAAHIEVTGQKCGLLALAGAAEAEIPAGTAVITYTSGTTGDPKGVCLSLPAIEQVAASLLQASKATESDRHLCLLPLAVLLENIGGIFGPLLAGASCCLPGLQVVGVQGSSQLDVRRMLTALGEQRATSCILLPQMLQALVAGIEAGLPKPTQLRFAAVGGAPVAESMLVRAEALGIPVYEGYGLTEAASVVAVNRPGERKIGSVGRPLPHVDLSFAADGEILVKGSLFSGYLGANTASLTDGYWPTGDLGRLDEEGFLHLTGRKKHMFITAFGRNVAPEWVERELCIEPEIGQAVVYGEARPFNIAVLVPRTESDVAGIEAAVARANLRLPDYAGVRRWLIAKEPFSTTNGLFTGTGRPRRTEIWQVYAGQAEALYREKS